VDDRGFESRQGLGIFLFTTVSGPALGPTQPSIQWVPGALSLGVKRPWCETGHSSTTSVEVKNAWSCISTPPIRLHGVVLSLEKHRNNFTLTFTLGKKSIRRGGLAASRSKHTPITRFYEHGNEFLGSIKVGNVLTSWETVISFLGKLLCYGISFCVSSIRAVTYYRLLTAVTDFNTGLILFILYLVSKYTQNARTQSSVLNVSSLIIKWSGFGNNGGIIAPPTISRVLWLCT
jgi:hypothetical protein